MTPAQERRLNFEFLVIQALWLILRQLLIARADRGGPASRDQMTEALWRANALSHFDVHGNQSEGAAQYRRETTLPEVPPTWRS